MQTFGLLRLLSLLMYLFISMHQEDHIAFILRINSYSLVVASWSPGLNRLSLSTTGKKVSLFMSAVGIG